MNARKLVPALRVLVSLLLIYLLYRKTDLRQIHAILSDARAGPLVVVFVQLFLNTAISALKWRLFLRADGIQVPLAKLIASYLVGSFFNIFLPSNIGGDAYRIYDVAQYSRRTANSFMSVLADRLSGFVALVALGFLFGVLGYRSLPNPEVFLIPVVAMLGLAAVIGLLIQQRLARWFLARPPFSKLPKLASFGGGLLDSVEQYRRAPGLYAMIMGLSFLFQLNAICCVYMMSVALNFDIPLIYFCIFVPFISLMEALPISIYGLGIRDGMYVFFFTPTGVSREQALTMALAYVLVTLLYSVSGGILFMLRRSAPKGA